MALKFFSNKQGSANLKTSESNNARRISPFLKGTILFTIPFLTATTLAEPALSGAAEVKKAKQKAKINSSSSINDWRLPSKTSNVSYGFVLQAEAIFEWGGIKASKEGINALALLLAKLEPYPKEYIGIADSLSWIGWHAGNEKAITDLVKHFSNMPRELANELAFFLMKLSYQENSEKTLPAATTSFLKLKSYPKMQKTLLDLWKGAAKSYFQNRFIQLASTLSSPEMLRYLTKFENSSAESRTAVLTAILYSKNEKDALSISKCILPFKDNPQLANAISESLTNFFEESDSEVEQARIAVARCIQLFKTRPELANKLANLINALSKHESAELIRFVANSIAKFEKRSEVVNELIDVLTEISSYETGDPHESIPIIKSFITCVSKFEKEHDEYLNELINSVRWMIHHTRHSYIIDSDCEYSNEATLAAIKYIAGFQNDVYSATRLAEVFGDGSREESKIYLAISCVSKFKNQPAATMGIINALKQLPRKVRNYYENAPQLALDTLSLKDVNAFFTQHPDMTELLLHLIEKNETERAEMFTRAKALQEEYNITLFARYSLECLNELYSNIGKRQSSKPLFVLVNAKADNPNPSSYSAAGDIDDLRRIADLRIYECENENDVFQLQKLKSTYGAFDRLIIHGHGQPYGIRLGFEQGERGWDNAHLDVGDWGAINELGKLMNAGSFIILDSCLTAGILEGRANIAKMLSEEAPNCLVFAPVTITNGANRKSLWTQQTLDCRWTTLAVYFRGENVTSKIQPDPSAFLSTQISQHGEIKVDDFR
ncbi:MAG: hypothetical protein ABIH99_05590 [Candidatus Micrarchaeota archaeon]